jgi:hypothetical protein
MITEGRNDNISKNTLDHKKESFCKKSRITVRYSKKRMMFKTIHDTERMLNDEKNNEIRREYAGMITTVKTMKKSRKNSCNLLN